MNETIYRRTRAVDGIDALDYRHAPEYGDKSSGFRAMLAPDSVIGAGGLVRLVSVYEGEPVAGSDLYLWESTEFDAIIAYLEACKTLLRSTATPSPMTEAADSLLETYVHPYNDDDAERWESVALLYLGGYSWSIAGVWRDKTTGRLYGDTDSGCSCYGPFEESGWAASKWSFDELIEVAHPRDAATLIDGLEGEYGAASITERQDFIRAVEVALSR